MILGDSMWSPFFVFWLMSIQGLIGQKIEQTQAFLEDGTRIPVSRVRVGSNIVVQIKTKDKEGYNALQVGFGTRKHATKPILGHTKRTGTLKAPRFLREIAVGNTEEFPVGTKITASDVFTAGDLVDVIGTSKGKGYAGVVKRHHFKGGPRTHGQSDRERAPGSIGQTTTPGRVYRGKRMSGHMGDAQTTVKNLVVVEVSGDTVSIKGLLPGSLESEIFIRKQGKAKHFTPLFTKVVTEQAGEVAEQKDMEPESIEATDAKSESETASSDKTPKNETAVEQKEEVTDAK